VSIKPIASHLSRRTRRPASQPTAQHHRNADPRGKPAGVAPGDGGGRCGHERSWPPRSFPSADPMYQRRAAVPRSTRVTIAANTNGSSKSVPERRQQVARWQTFSRRRTQRHAATHTLASDAAGEARVRPAKAASPTSRGCPGPHSVGYS